MSSHRMSVAEGLMKNRNFYNMRLEKRRAAEMAKRNQERLRNPATFPAVPSGELGGGP